MTVSGNKTIEWLCILSLTICMTAEFISDYTGIDPWSMVYFGIVLAAISIFIIILNFKKRKSE